MCILYIYIYIYIYIFIFWGSPIVQMRCHSTALYRFHARDAAMANNTADQYLRCRTTEHAKLTRGPGGRAGREKERQAGQREISKASSDKEPQKNYC